MNATATQTIVLVTDGDFENASEITVPADLIREDDQAAHIEDDLMVNHIVNGKLVPCRWNDLTADEQRAAREAFLQSFEPSYY